MAHYVDGFVIPLPKKHLNAYRRLAQKAGEVWRDHGALDFKECVGDDLNVKMALSFPRGIKTKPGETVLFSYIVFKSRAHRAVSYTHLRAHETPEHLVCRLLL